MPPGRRARPAGSAAPVRRRPPPRPARPPGERPVLVPAPAPARRSGPGGGATPRARPARCGPWPAARGAPRGRRRVERLQPPQLGQPPLGPLHRLGPRRGLVPGSALAGHQCLAGLPHVAGGAAPLDGQGGARPQVVLGGRHPGPVHPIVLRPQLAQVRLQPSRFGLELRPRRPVDGLARRQVLLQRRLGQDLHLHAGQPPALGARRRLRHLHQEARCRGRRGRSRPGVAAAGGQEPEGGSEGCGAQGAHVSSPSPRRWRCWTRRPRRPARGR